MTNESAWASYALQMSVFAGIVLLLVLLIISNRRAKPISNSKNDGASVPRWNSNAVGAFVGSFFMILIPLIVAIVSLVQIAKTKQRGVGFAFAAIVIQAVLTIGFVANVRH